MPLASHIQLPERYRVTRHIASGGMASVWEVEDLLLGRVVAVKVLGAQYAADSGARARFAREARTAARACDHPHIATIYDIGEHGEHGEDAFIVMEYFSGGTIADQLRTAAKSDRRVPHESALRWLREAASGLDHAHAAGIIHRDVKPANLLLDGQARLAVGDFGIARLADDTHMTQTGQLLGTAAYLSPEQAIGQHATAASDRYAFAVVAYELLTGTRPFAGGPPTAQVRQHAEAQPLRASEAAPGLPSAVDGVLARGLAKEPGERPLTASELVGEIERALDPSQQTERTQRLAAVAPPPVPTPAPTPVVPSAPVAPVQAAVARGRPRETPPAAVHEAAPPPRRPTNPSAAAPASAPPGRRARRMPPLVPIGIAAAAVGAVLAILLAGGGDDQTRSPSSTARASQTPSERTQTSAAQAQAPADAQQPTQTSAAADAGASSGDPSDLNDQGHTLNQSGDFARAVPLLRASVEGFRSASRTSEINYAYALYNLGVALVQTGDPAGAIELFEERLRYPDQQGTVRKALREAQAQVDGAGGGKAKKPKPADGEADDEQ